MQFAITGTTGAAISSALDGLALRHAAIAANIANADSTGYRPMRVSFEDRLARLLDAQNSSSADFEAAAQVSLDPPLSAGAGSALLETQVVDLNRNVIQYEALIKGLNKQAAILSAAISEGKR